MSDLDSMTNIEVAEDLRKLNIELSKKGQLHAYEDAIMLQATKRLESAVIFNDPETIKELKRLVSRHGLSFSQRLLDYVECPQQFSIYHTLGLFSKWFHCTKFIGKPEDGQDGYCKKDAIWLTNPHSEKAHELFESIALDAGIKDKDYASRDGENALSAYYGEHLIEIMEPQFRCEEHIKKLKEIAIKI